MGEIVGPEGGCERVCEGVVRGRDRACERAVGPLAKARSSAFTLSAADGAPSVPVSPMERASSDSAAGTVGVWVCAADPIDEVIDPSPWPGAEPSPPCVLTRRGSERWSRPRPSAASTVSRCVGE